MEVLVGQRNVLLFHPQWHSLEHTILKKVTFNLECGGIKMQRVNTISDTAASLVWSRCIVVCWVDSGLSYK